MRRLVATVMVALVSGGLAGCVGGGGPTPSPSPVVTPSPVVSPSPTWKEKEQGALDAVYKYLDVWADISQNLAQADWNRIREVATDPAVNDAFLIWGEWKNKGWHVDGKPGFEPDYINLGMMDYEGDRYHVHGCYDITNTYLVDENGNHVGERGAERTIVSILVLLKASDGTYRVLQDTPEEGTC